jgi:hypothetical protein
MTTVSKLFLFPVARHTYDAHNEREQRCTSRWRLLGTDSCKRYSSISSHILQDMVSQRIVVGRSFLDHFMGGCKSTLSLYALKH